AEFVNRIRLHQVALGDPVPSRSLPELLGSDIDFVEGRVAALDPDAGRAEVATADGTRRVPFDRVVIAAGSGTEHAPIPGGEHVRGIGDVDTARTLRPELAALPAGSVVTVVGGGLTGLETASEFAEFRPDLRVRLVTAGEVGGWFTERGADYVRATLRELGVDAVGGVRVREAGPGRLRLDGGAELDSDLTVWCGGDRKGVV